MSTSSSSAPGPATRILQRLALAGAILANLAIAVLALRPDVSDAYRGYFITGESDCLPRPIDGGAAVGETMALTNDSPWPRRIVSCGMADPEPNGAWTFGNRTELLLKLPPGVYQGTLQVSDVALDRAVLEQRVEIAVGGTTVATLSLATKAPRDIVFPLPADAIAPNGTVRVSILLPDATAHRSGGERRPLGVKIASVRVEPRDDGPSPAATPPN